jgi:hypothetical protein
MEHDEIDFHNVGELCDRDGEDGLLIQRVPEAVRTELNEGAQRRMRHPTGAELRFVPGGPEGIDGTVEVTLSVSVNMVGAFEPDVFHERAANLVETVASANPDRPVACITIFRNSRDVVADSPRDNVHLLEGPELLPSIDGLTTDLVHPGDGAMVTIGENLATELAPLVE